MYRILNYRNTLIVFDAKLIGCRYLEVLHFMWLYLFAFNLMGVEKWSVHVVGDLGSKYDATR